MTFKPVILPIKVGEGGDKAGACNPYQIEYPIGSTSFHVIQYAEDFKLQVNLLQLIIPDENIECEVVDESTEIRILNGV